MTKSGQSLYYLVITNSGVRPCLCLAASSISHLAIQHPSALWHFDCRLWSVCWHFCIAHQNHSELYIGLGQPVLLKLGTVIGILVEVLWEVERCYTYCPFWRYQPKSVRCCQNLAKHCWRCHFRWFGLFSRIFWRCLVLYNTTIKMSKVWCHPRRIFSYGTKQWAW